METPQTESAPTSFEEALAELETLVQNMESGKLSLEASLSTYQRGAQLLKYCQGVLVSAESQIQILDNGQLRTFQATDSAETT